MRASVIGLICMCLVINGGNAQFLARLFNDLNPHHRNNQQLPERPVEGSVSTADSEAYNQNVQLGKKLSVNRGITKSESVTQNENGSTNEAKSTSLTKGVKIGKLDISSTLTGSKDVDNGRVSGALTENLNIGKLDIDGSLSRENLKNGLGIHRTADGGLDLNLGLLDIDLSKKKKQPTSGQTATQAEVQAVGTGANANSISNTDSQTNQIGRITSTQTHSKSNAVGSVLQGFTRGQAGGIAGGEPSYVSSNGWRRRRRQTDFFFPGQFNFNPNGFGQNNGPNFLRPERQPQRKQNTHHQQIQRPGGVVQPQTNKANAQGIANNENSLFTQQAGANTNSQNTVNELGQFQDNTGSSISSNIAKDKSSGKVSSANTAQQNYETAQGSGSKNSAQSQSLNFDKDSTQATSSNANTNHVKTANSDRIDANSGATSNQQTALGTAVNTAQTSTSNFDENGRKGSESNANSQSTFKGTNGGVGAANTGTKSESIQGPNGSVTNSASSQASSFSNNGGPASASASSSSGTLPNGASFTNAQGLANTNGAGSNALSQSGLGGGRPSFANGQAGAFGNFNFGNFNAFG